MKKVFWGLFFILAAVFIVVDQMNLLNLEFGLLHIVAALILIPLFFQNIIKLNFSGAMFPLGFFLMFFKDFLYMENVSNWTIFFAAILSSIGLEIIFGKRRKSKVIKINKHRNKHEDIVEHGSESNVVFKVNLGSGVRYVDSADFQSANLECSLGAMKVYFDNSQIIGDSATVYIDAQLSGVELYFPKEWNVVNELDASLANVEIKRSCAGNTTDKTVYLKGDAHLGSIEVHCV